MVIIKVDAPQHVLSTNISLCSSTVSVFAVMHTQLLRSIGRLTTDIVVVIGWGELGGTWFTVTNFIKVGLL